MNWKVVLVVGMCVAGTVRANPFFAMDTSVRDLKELNTVKELGYEGISWRSGPPEALAADAENIRRHGLRMFAIFNYTPITLDRTNLTWSEELEADIVALKDSGTIIWLPIGSQAYPHSSPDGDAIAVPALQRLADFAASNGVRIAIYPHTGNWAERAQDAVRLAQKVGRKNFGVTFNLCHCLMVGDEATIPEILTAASPYLFLVTINGADSNSAHTSWDQLIRPLDEGSYDVSRLLGKLKELNYTGPIGLQGYGVKVPVKDNLARSIVAWRRLNEKK